MFCRQCGSELLDGDAFCHACGAKVVGNENAKALPSETTQDNQIIDSKNLGGLVQKIKNHNGFKFIVYVLGVLIFVIFLCAISLPPNIPLSVFIVKPNGLTYFIAYSLGTTLVLFLVAVLVLYALKTITIIHLPINMLPKMELFFTIWIAEIIAEVYAGKTLIQLFTGR